jgi:hypothetical protein
METKNWKDLWNENYEGKGDCEGLHERVKHLTKKDQKTIIASYLPWAIVERIFRMQGGEIEVLRIKTEAQTIPDGEGGTLTVVRESESIVEPDRLFLKTSVNSASGVVNEIWANSYFVNVKVTWQGREYIEHYPLLSSTNQPLSLWNQGDLNRAVQRAKVKAIAIVSGIGYKLFEDGDLQFGDDEEEEKTVSTPKPPSTSKPKPNKRPKAAAKPKVEKDPEPKPEPKPEPEPEQTVMDDLETSDLPRNEMEEVIKKAFFKSKAKGKIIQTLLADKGFSRIQELSDKDLTSLYLEVK